MLRLVITPVGSTLLVYTDAVERAANQEISP